MDLEDIFKGGIFAVVLNILAEILGKLLEPFNEICNGILNEYTTLVSIREQELYGIPHSRLVGTALFPLQEQDEVTERIDNQKRDLESDEQKWKNRLVTVKLAIGGLTIGIFAVAALWVVFGVQTNPWLGKIIQDRAFVLGLIVLLFICIGIGLFLLRAIDYENKHWELHGLVEDMINWPGHVPYISEVRPEPMVVRILRLSIRGVRAVPIWFRKEFILLRDTLSDLPPSQ